MLNFPGTFPRSLSTHFSAITYLFLRRHDFSYQDSIIANIGIPM